jgi:N-acetylmuramoyl-L-alanine amidase
MKKFVLIISPSQQIHNKYVDSVLTEEQVMGIVTLFLNDRLSKKYETYLVDTGDMQNNIKMSNQICADVKKKYGKENVVVIHFSVHSNAFRGTSRGALGLYYSDAGRKMLETVLKPLFALTEVKDEGLRQDKTLAELRKTDAIAGLVEVSYHDNKTDKEWILNNVNEIATALSKGFDEYAKTI